MLRRTWIILSLVLAAFWVPASSHRLLQSLGLIHEHHGAQEATVASISGQPRATTAQALKGYAYPKSHSSRSRSSRRQRVVAGAIKHQRRF